jgi:hypothetical protein
MTAYPYKGIYGTQCYGSEAEQDAARSRTEASRRQEMWSLFLDLPE